MTISTSSKLSTYCQIAAITLLLTGCAPTISPQAAQPAAGRPACQAGGDARGLAAGFFAFFQDSPECF